MYLVFLVLFPLQCLAHPLFRRTSFDEDEARAFLYLSAGAYSHSPEACMNKALSPLDDWMLYSKPQAICDQRSSLCSGYIIRSDVAKQIIIVFQGTRNMKQLLTEAWDGIQPGNDFYGIGKVNRYFSQALDTLWPQIEPVFNDYMFRDYSLALTGHSLGGALAALTAAKLVMEGLRDGNQIRLVTFGQPRVGDRDFAFNFDKLIKHSYRVVHREDIVPHLPACEKDKSDVETRKSDSKKCDSTVTGHAYHHGTEIWYPYGMHEGAGYIECLGEPKNEDFACSDSANFKLSKRRIYVKDHGEYFDHQVAKFGKLGCSDVVDNAALAAKQFVADTESTSKPSVFKQVISKVKSLPRILGIIA